MQRLKAEKTFSPAGLKEAGTRTLQLQGRGFCPQPCERGTGPPVSDKNKACLTV